MSDTPRTDAVYNVELLERGIQEHGRTWGWGTVSDFRDLCRELERELTESKHRIRRLIEERDRARIQADHKWRLREEFEALLGTNDVETGVERVKEAQKGAARYEYVRKLVPVTFRDLWEECVFKNVNFDAEVDRRRNQT